ncbi:MAG: prolyl oligopeptidase family serine peptidase, partial [Simkaniaceae bacterium]|nr:prolyl oligopeptidase family serine peptidase [Simkaniaceae bacterium]
MKHPAVISSDEAASNLSSISGLQSTSSHLYFTETRPNEGGRTTLLSYDGQSIVECLSSTFSIRSRVHEYGGRAFCVHDDHIFFVNQSDQGIYELSKEGPELIYHRKDCRFGDPVYDPLRENLYALLEEHTPNQDVRNSIAKIDLKTKTLTKVAESADFYSSITLRPDGEELTWVEWNHPHMPWDTSSVSRATLDPQGAFLSISLVCSLSHTSAQDPIYLDNRSLIFMWDKTGFWNPYHTDYLEAPIIRTEADFAQTPWNFGVTRTCILENQLFAVGTEKGCDFLAKIDIKTNTLYRYDLPFNLITHITAYQNQIALIASTETEASSLILLNPTAPSEHQIIHSTLKTSIDPSYFSLPESIELTNRHREQIYGFLYLPHQVTKELPFLIVKCHSGPTSHVSPSLNLQTQFYTTHGYAVFEINYGGSTGYGKAYRDRLENRWGELDVEDVIDGVTYLIENKRVDPKRIAIMGSSSGGLTALLSAARSPLFSHCIVLYPVADPIKLIQDTHKFEKHYTDHL